jgi:hypothetical protein
MGTPSDVVKAHHMDIELIEQSLPNGFHDAYLTRFALDLVRRDVDLLLDVLMADDDLPRVERYQSCKLTLHDYAVVTLEPAVAYREIKRSEGLEVDRVQLKEEDYRALIEAGYEIPAGNFWLALFVYSWNSRIIINARDATLEFLSPTSL